MPNDSTVDTLKVYLFFLSTPLAVITVATFRIYNELGGFVSWLDPSLNLLVSIVLMWALTKTGDYSCSAKLDLLNNRVFFKVKEHLSILLLAVPKSMDISKIELAFREQVRDKIVLSR